MYTLPLACLLSMGLFVITVASSNQKTITIATFNIQNLGPTKMTKPEVVQHLKQIMSRYDLIAVQEVQDKTGKAVAQLNEILNKGISASKKYKYVLSDRVGDKPGEVEQYALFYRPTVAKVLRAEHYPDDLDIYSRVPFLTEIKFRVPGIPTTVIVNLHTRPDASRNKVTVQEIDHLFDIYDYIKTKMAIKNVLFMGDMNADGSYVGVNDWKNIRIRTDPSFMWLISDDADTTVGNSHMAYDRIIAAGEELKSSVIVSSALPYRFDDEWAETGDQPLSKNTALQISDHYPVEVTLGRPIY